MAQVNFFAEGQGLLKTLGRHLLPAVVGIVTVTPARHVVSFSLCFRFQENIIQNLRNCA